MNKPKAFLFMGIPGSGKGTQADLLAKILNSEHFTTSKALKDYMASHDDPETEKQKRIYKEGKLNDPSWVLQVVKKETSDIYNKGNGIVYDGSPRTLFEAENLLPFLVDLFGKENIVVIRLIVSVDEIKERLKKRIICSLSTSHAYTTDDGFKIGDDCPTGDSGTLEKRDIDDPKKFETRVDEFNKRTMPAIEFFEKNHGVIEINGEQTPDKVHEEILSKLNLK